MTLAKAKLCSGLIIDNGFDATLHKVNDLNDATSWQVRATSGSFNITSSQITAIENAQGVTAKLAEVLLT